jgi:hypothetical protein
MCRAANLIWAPLDTAQHLVVLGKHILETQSKYHPFYRGIIMEYQSKLFLGDKADLMTPF